MYIFGTFWLYFTKLQYFSFIFFIQYLSLFKIRSFNKQTGYKQSKMNQRAANSIHQYSCTVPLRFTNFNVGFFSLLHPSAWALLDLLFIFFNCRFLLNLLQVLKSTLEVNHLINSFIFWRQFTLTFNRREYILLVWRF